MLASNIDVVYGNSVFEESCQQDFPQLKKRSDYPTW